jgi:hypothetical protein
MSTPENPSEAHKALAVLATILPDRQARRAIANDPGPEFIKRGVNWEALPEDVRDFFEDLSLHELRMLARMQSTMEQHVEAGLAEEVQVNHPATLGKL